MMKFQTLLDDITLTLAPGICNSSESVYIRRVVYHAQFQGYRVAVLNHVGALKCVPVTSPRIFNYGKNIRIIDTYKKSFKIRLIFYSSTIIPFRFNF